MKIAVVTVTYVPEDKWYDKHKVLDPISFDKRSKDEVRYYCEENYLSSIQVILSCYKLFKTDLPIQHVIVDNNSQDIDWLRKLDSLEEQGFLVLRRENRSMAPGGYRYAFEQLGDKFDYYLFHEQDVAPAKDYWLEEIYNLFNSKENIGAVGNFRECVRKDNSGLDFDWGLDGAFMFTSYKILKECGITLYDSDGRKNDVFNEMMLVGNIVKKGYELLPYADLNSKKHTFGWGSDCLLYNIVEGKIGETITPMISIHCRRHEPVYDYFKSKGLIWQK